ncbi:MAG: hypothetical protein ALAOOOJD_03774 [bacterium]|nr:hypothetical protein [bacterium]
MQPLLKKPIQLHAADVFANLLEARFIHMFQRPPVEILVTNFIKRLGADYVAQHFIKDRAFGVGVGTIRHAVFKFVGIK